MQAKIIPNAKNQYHAILITRLLKPVQTVTKNKVKKKTLNFNNGTSYHFIFLTKDSANFFIHIAITKSIFVLLEYMLFGKEDYTFYLNLANI